MTGYNIRLRQGILKISKMLYHKHIPGKSNKYWFIFSVPIGTYKKNSSSISYRHP